MLPRFRFPSLFFAILGILGSILVLFSILVIPERFLGFLVFTIAVLGFLSVLSIASGLTLWKSERFGRFIALITSIITILIGGLGTFDIVLTTQPFMRESLRLFYVSLALIGILMLISVAAPWLLFKTVRVARPAFQISLVLLSIVLLGFIQPEGPLKGATLFLGGIILLIGGIGSLLTFSLDYYQRLRNKREQEKLIRRFDRANDDFRGDVANRKPKIKEFCDKWDLPKIRPAECPEEIFEEFWVHGEG